MALYVGDTNKIIRVATGFDMSSYTGLSLIFTLPDSTTSTKTTTDGITIGAGVTDPDLGVLAANEYMEYPTETGFLSQSGTWYVVPVYTDTVAGSIFYGPCTAFTVTSITCA